MIRKLMVFALLGLLPLVVGCDEIVKGSETTKADKKTTLEKPIDKSASAEAPKKSKKPELADFSTADPLIGSAIQSRQQLADQEDALFERLDEVRTLFASAKADPIRMRRSIEEFLGIVKEIRRIVIKAGASLTALDESTRDLARSMKHLGSSYSAAAGLFRQKSQDYTEKRLRDILNGFADDYESIGKTIPERTKSLQKFQTTLPLLKGKVREANSFLEDVVLYLSSHPGVGTDPHEVYASQVELFVNTFSELLRTLDDFRNTFREQAISKAIQDACRADVFAKQKLEQAQCEELAKQEMLKQQETERQAQAKRDEEAKIHELARQEEFRRQQEMQKEMKRQELAKRQENERKEQAARDAQNRAKKNGQSFGPIQSGLARWSPSGPRYVVFPGPSMRGPISYTPPPVERNR